jgi:hypothetical protein
MRRIGAAIPALFVGFASLIAVVAIVATGALSQDIGGSEASHPFRNLVQGDEMTPGSTRYMRARDRFRLFQLGRDLIQRNFTRRDGAMARPGELTIPLYVNESTQSDGINAYRMRRDHASSCGFCHSNPPGQPGSGTIILSTGPNGRKTPHFFGAGLVEMIGDEIRKQILKRCDQNGNGFIDIQEARASCEALIETSPGGQLVSFGNTGFDQYGRPRLNSVVRTWFVDRYGHPIDAANGFETDVAGYDFAIYLFGWGRGTRTTFEGARLSEGGDASTLREIFAVAAESHMGMASFDPVQVDPSGSARGGHGGISLSAKPQYDYGAVRRTEQGSALALGPGDIDAAEFYMLHLPPPAEIPSAAASRGHSVFTALGCGTCHVETWQISGGDRRLFALYPDGSTRQDGTPEVRLKLIDYLKESEAAGRSQPLTIKGVYSDFRHWDIGERFYELRYDGTIQKCHRTAPLWGVGTTAPYGHDGRFPDLDSVIRAHAGAARPQAQRFINLGSGDRGDLLTFLASLVLYQIDRVPADLDGDGVYGGQMTRSGRSLGYERFDPRLLFMDPRDIDVVAEVPGPDGYPLPLVLFRTEDAGYANSPYASAAEKSK